MNTNEVLKLALEALEFNDRRFDIDNYPDKGTTRSVGQEAITALREALAQPQQEPVAWMSDHAVGFKKSEFGATPTVPLYTSPPAQEIVCSTGLCHYRKPLTDPEIYKAINDWTGDTDPEEEPSALDIARAIEAAYGIKGDA